MNLKKKFKLRKKIFGGWVSIGDFQLTEILSNLNVDFIGFDFEHTPLTVENFLQQITLCHSKNILCLSRIPDIDKTIIKKLLDSGADGIIAPNIESVDQIKELNSFIKYPKNGLRGYCISKASNYGFNFDNYTKNWNKNSILIIQIESINAVENIEKLVSQKEVDGVMIGPYDLSGSLGVTGKMYHPKVRLACSKVISACKKYKKSCGFHDTKPDGRSIKKLLKTGYNFLVIGSDILTFWRWVENTNKILAKNE